MRFKAQLIVSACMLMLAACRPLRMSGSAPIATPHPPPFCALKVNGATLQNSQGNTIALHGAALPTLKAMAISGESPEARLRALAAAGAQLVRLPITDEEFNAPFVPEKLLPFTDLANELGMVVVLSWQQPTENRTVSVQAGEIEDWLRILVIYIADRPGIWLDPFNQPLALPPVDKDKKIAMALGRQRSVAQRMADVLAGYRYKNIVLINNPIWMLDGDSEHIKPLVGGNVVYGVDDLDLLNKYPTDRVPFFWMAMDDPTRAPANINTVAIEKPAAPNILKTFWHAQNKVSLTGCK